ncbi:MAG TPA: SH3 domain-containing protein [Marmoricola sp.]
MPRGNPGRHVARHRAERPPLSARLPLPDSGKVAVIAAPLATVAAVGVGVAVSGGARPATADLGASASSDLGARSAVGVGARTAALSRDLDRLAPEVTGHDWATADLNVYTDPDDHARQLDEIKSGSKIGVTGTTQGAFTQVVANGRAAWVHSAYVADKKPVDPASIGLVFKPCPATASVEHGLTTSMIRVWEVVCNAFPQVHTYGGLANRPEHNTGKALDVMVYGDTALGYRIAEFVQAHASELNLYDLIYRQHIWTPVRASEGWRLMPNRGSATANHMDHVHIGVN